MSVRTDQQKLTAAERRDKVMGMRRTGATYESIAKTLGISKSQVGRDIERAIADLPRHNSEQLVALTNERYELVIRSLAPQVVKGHIGATQQFLNAIAGQKKLFGLDAPQKLDLGMPEIDLDKAAAEIMAAVRGPAWDDAAAGLAGDEQ